MNEFSNPYKNPSFAEYTPDPITFEGKEVFLIKVPKNFKLADIGTAELEEYKELTDFYVANENQLHRLEATSLRLSLPVELPDSSTIAAEIKYSEYVKRQHPPNLKMRFFPIGFGEHAPAEEEVPTFVEVEKVPELSLSEAKTEVVDVKPASPDTSEVKVEESIKKTKKKKRSAEEQNGEVVKKKKKKKVKTEE